MRPGGLASGLGRLLLAAALAAALPAAAAETVICKDGTTDEGGRGACRGHGGVDKKATAAGKGGAAAPAGKAAAEAKPEKKARKSKAERAAEAKTAEAAAPAEKKAARKEKAAAGATVTCKDGTTDEGGRGACRGHGGVDKKATASRSGGGAAPAAPAPAPAAAAPAPAAAAPRATPPAPSRRAEPAGDKGPPTARCKDGVLSYAKHHTGACANHGGVAEWLDGTEKK